MSGFTERDIEYLEGQPLGRLAPVDASGRPHVVPVSFRYSAGPSVIDVGWHNMGLSKKFRGVKQTGQVAFVVDDVLPPWQARDEVGPGFGDELIRILPGRVIGRGIDSDAFSPNARSVSR